MTKYFNLPSLDHVAAPKCCANCEKQARPTSLYCSDSCRKEFLTFPAQENN